MILWEVNLVIKDLRKEFSDVLFLRLILGDACLDDIIKQLLQLLSSQLVFASPLLIVEL
jgi:hypothetical protein